MQDVRFVAWQDRNMLICFEFHDTHAA